MPRRRWDACTAQSEVLPLRHEAPIDQATEALLRANGREGVIDPCPEERMQQPRVPRRILQQRARLRREVARVVSKAMCGQHQVNVLQTALDGASELVRDAPVIVRLPQEECEDERRQGDVQIPGDIQREQAGHQRVACVWCREHGPIARQARRGDPQTHT